MTDGEDMQYYVKRIYVTRCGTTVDIHNQVYEKIFRVQNKGFKSFTNSCIKNKISLKTIIAYIY